jgi:hypothetical protein
MYAQLYDDELSPGSTIGNLRGQLEQPLIQHPTIKRDGITMCLDFNLSNSPAQERMTSQSIPHPPGSGSIDCRR